MAGAPDITAFFDEATNSVSYLVADPATRAAAIIDPILDFDAASGAIATRSADKILAAAAERGSTIQWVFETHAHADHLSAARSGCAVPSLRLAAAGRYRRRVPIARDCIDHDLAER